MDSVNMRHDGLQDANSIRYVLNTGLMIYKHAERYYLGGKDDCNANDKIVNPKKYNFYLSIFGWIYIDVGDKIIFYKLKNIFRVKEICIYTLGVPRNYIVKLISFGASSSSVQTEQMM